MMESDWKHSFEARALDHLRKLVESNQEAISKIVARMLSVVESDGLIYAAGTGHSVALVLESFYRAGGLACVFPLYHPALLPLAGGQVSTRFERSEGFAELLIEQANPGPDDMAFIFTNSGVNPVPVELADGLKRRGTTVVAVVSIPHLTDAPKRAASKIDQLADVVLDTLVPYGDAVHTTGEAMTAPLSSLCGVYLWNVMLARLADEANQAGVHLPIWVSSNVEGGDERNRALLDRYGARIPHL